MKLLHPAVIYLTAVLFCAVVSAEDDKSYRFIAFRQFRCTKRGFFPHPTDPAMFYECVASRSGHHPRLISYTYSCAPDCYDRRASSKCSFEACPRNETDIGKEEEEWACLKAHLQTDAEKICEDETLSELDKYSDQMLEFTATRGSPFENLKLSIRDVNWAMRQNYGKMIETVGKNVFPLMVATDGEPDYFGVGGVFKVYFKDGTMKRIIPVSPTFELHKGLSHVVLGIFSIVSPYFLSPNSITWQPPLLSFKQNLNEILHLLTKSGNSEIDQKFPKDQKDTSAYILRKSIAYIDDAILRNSVKSSDYKRFANELAPYIEKCMGWAAKAHAEDTIPALQKFKAEIGEEEWKKLHVIIPTVWPVSLYNIRLQALEKVMSFEQIKNQVLIVEGAQSEQEAKTTLGRVVADRVVAQLVWGGLEEDVMKDHIFSLSTKRDLLSSTTARELERTCQTLETQNKPKCPFSGRSAANSNGIMNTKDGSSNYRFPATMLRS